MSAEAVTGKAAIREQLRQARGQLSAETREAASADLRIRILDSDAWQSARSVLLFAPLPDEPDIWPLLDAAFAAGKTTVLPRFLARVEAYEAARVVNLSADLRAGRFGIREPAAHCPAVTLNQLDLILVPGIGFDAGGHRLGRGKGYFDRLLEQVRGIKLGVAFDSQIVECLPREPHDVQLDGIVTPTRWLSCSGRAVVK